MFLNHRAKATSVLSPAHRAQQDTANLYRGGWPHPVLCMTSPKWGELTWRWGREWVILGRVCMGLSERRLKSEDSLRKAV